MPRFQKPFGPSPEPGKLSRFATAPVATTTASATTVLESVKTLKGRAEKSTLVTVSVKICVPNRSDWLRQRSMSSMPRIPSGKPGKFSTSEVVVSWPPGGDVVGHPPLEQDRLELGAGGVDGGGVGRGAAADDADAGLRGLEVVHGGGAGGGGGGGGGERGGGGGGGEADEAAGFAEEGSEPLRAEAHLNGGDSVSGARALPSLPWTFYSVFRRESACDESAEASAECEQGEFDFEQRWRGGTCVVLVVVVRAHRHRVTKASKSEAKLRLDFACAPAVDMIGIGGAVVRMGQEIPFFALGGFPKWDLFQVEEAKKC
ncbi:hypothetical protein NL676_006519 [Syzygium grande]|nr:hypothetical protein NL676_006519 [Syzygium grande]